MQPVASAGKVTWTKTLNLIGWEDNRWRQDQQDQENITRRHAGRTHAHARKKCFGDWANQWAYKTTTNAVSLLYIMYCFVCKKSLQCSNWPNWRRILFARSLVRSMSQNTYMIGCQLFPIWVQRTKRQKTMAQLLIDKSWKLFNFSSLQAILFQLAFSRRPASGERREKQRWDWREGRSNARAG